MRGVARPVDAGQRPQHLQLGRAEPTPGGVARHVAGLFAVDLGIGGITETELQPGLNEVFEARADVHPSVRGDDHVYAEAESTRGDGLDGGLDWLVVATEGGHAVDNEEDVAEAVVDETPARRRR